MIFPSISPAVPRKIFLDFSSHYIMSINELDMDVNGVDLN
jgi:hypothetical protein